MILRFLGFFSSSFSRKPHNPWRPSSLPQYHRGRKNLCSLGPTVLSHRKNHYFFTLYWVYSCLIGFLIVVYYRDVIPPKNQKGRTYIQADTKSRFFSSWQAQKQVDFPINHITIRAPRTDFCTQFCVSEFLMAPMEGNCLQPNFIESKDVGGLKVLPCKWGEMGAPISRAK